MNSSLESIISSNPPSQEASPSRWRRRLVTSVPWALLLGFALLAWVLFGENLMPATEVKVASVVTLRQAEGSEVDQAEVDSVEEVEVLDPYQAPMLFQASGWIEPDPLPIKATSLINGVVESVSVLEGDTVKKGQVLARLIREDFELDLATAQSELASLEAQAEAHEAAIGVVTAQVHTLHMKVKAGEMKCLELEDSRNRLERAGVGAIAEGELAKAKLMLQSHASEVDALEASANELLSEKKRLEAMRSDFSSKIARAKTEVDRRRLALDRTEVKSPVDGVVLRLLAVPGQKRMLDMDDPDSSTVAILYQPDYLQARIDVPLEEASQLAVGQFVRLRSNFLPDRIFQGTVTRIVGEADLQRNTLQAKVRVIDPDVRLRPDMLCRAEFLASQSGPSGQSNAVRFGSGSNRVAVYVPEAAVNGADGDSIFAWALNATGERVERRSVQLGDKRRERHILVLDGLFPGDRVVLNPGDELEEGDRVNWNEGGNNE